MLQALSHCVEIGDEIVFEVLVAGSRDVMSVVKGRSMPSTPSRDARTPGTPSSQTSSRPGELSVALSKTPGERKCCNAFVEIKLQLNNAGAVAGTCEIFWSRIGVPQDMDGSIVSSVPAHPPMPHEAPLRNSESLEGKVAFFGKLKRASIPLFYDCAWRAKSAGCIGAIFITMGNAERMASEEYHAPEGSLSHEDLVQGWGERLDFPVAFVDQSNAGLMVENSIISIYPEKSMRKALLGDRSASVRTAALQTICDCAVCDDLRLIETLTEMLVDSDRAVRHKCVDAFSHKENVTPGNEIAISGLAQQTTHEDPLVREAAIQALCFVCRRSETKVAKSMASVPPNPIAVNALKKRLQDKEGVVKKHAIDGLIQLAMEGGGVTSEDMSIVETFIDGLDDLDPLVMTACAKALARLSQEEVSLLRSMNSLQDKNQSRHPDCCVFGTREQGSIANAFSWMVDSRLDVRKEAVEALGQAKKGNLVAKGMLNRKYNDAEPPIRAAAIRGLSLITADGDEEVADILIRALNDSASMVRLQAVDGLEVCR